MATEDLSGPRVWNNQEGGYGHWETERYVDGGGNIKERKVWVQDTPRTKGAGAGGNNGGSSSPDTSKWPDYSDDWTNH